MDAIRKRNTFSPGPVRAFAIPAGALPVDSLPDAIFQKKKKTQGKKRKEKRHTTASRRREVPECCQNKARARNLFVLVDVIKAGRVRERDPIYPTAWLIGLIDGERAGKRRGRKEKGKRKNHHVIRCLQTTCINYGDER
jgi:hypothetical protein